MAKPKRKSPDKRKPASAPAAPGLLVKAGSALLALIGRHPRLFVGVAIFSLVFGSVAANALWYQPGQHPSPLMRTRSAEDFSALGSLNRAPADAAENGEVTTFRITREGEAASVEQAPGTYPDGTQPATSSDPAALVREIQALLQRRGFYDGEADGVVGPRTETAIATYQKTIAMEPDGLATEELLVALRLDGSITAAVPAQRPSPELAGPAAIDPVAAAIRKAETQIRPANTPAEAAANTAENTPAGNRVSVSAPPVPSRDVAARPVPAPSVSAPSVVADPGLVMEIQRGLTNMAFSDVSIDGLAGEETRAAIRRFERHYQLPVTGEPSLAVLAKLKAIGAL